MSKLTEIREALELSTPGPWETWEDDGYVKVQVKPEGPNICNVGKHGWGVIPDATFIANAPEYITYLLSLLEEKDKALQEIIETYDEGEQYFPVVRKMIRIARKALNTSSNKEGENTRD